MRVWTWVKLLAAMAVIGALAFTARLAYHVVVRPQGGVFQKIIPNPTPTESTQPDADFAKMVDSAEMPDIDPGEKIFQKALELIALGDIAGAREKLNTVVATYPTSSSATTARHIVGEMNLDEILSTTRMEGKQAHVVKRGDSYLGIAIQYKTTLDCIMHINGLEELKNLQPGEELVVMPLDFHFLIEPQRKFLSVWSGDRFVCEYPIVHLSSASKIVNQKTTVLTKSGQLDGRKIKPDVKTDAKSKGKADAASQVKSKTGVKADAKADPKSDLKGGFPAGKAIQLAKLPLQIRAYVQEDAGARGIFLSQADMEELFLLVRAGNAVEIRNSVR